MEKNSNHASVPTNQSCVHSSCEYNDIEILDKGTTICDVIDSKIKELALVDSEEPFFVADLDSVVKMYHKWITNLPRVKPFYAVKSNGTPAVVRMLKALGTGFDCASKGEIKQVLSLGVAPDRIIYAHTTKPLSHIRYARTHGVDMMTFDNEEELQKISLCHAKAKLVLRIAVDDSKALVGLNSKFGANLSSVGKLLECAAELGLQVIGISFHVGSGCSDCSAYQQAIADARLAFDTAKSLGFNMSLLDIGGGFRSTDECPVKFHEFAEVINESLDELFPPEVGLRIIAEPGRYFVEESFTLAMNVIAKRTLISDMDTNINGAEHSPVKKMMYYTNDGAYGSCNAILYCPGFLKFEPYPQRAVECSEPKYKSLIWGPTCDSLDKIIENYWLPELHVGDWLLIDNMGAYTCCCSTDFNSFGRARIYNVMTSEAFNILTSHVNMSASEV